MGVIIDIDRERKDSRKMSMTNMTLLFDQSRGDLQSDDVGRETDFSGGGGLGR
jgi:hypothetical protein